MSAGYTFIGELVGEHRAAIINAGVVAGVIGVAGLWGRAALARSKNPLVPEDRLTVRTMFELIVDFVINLGDSIMGPENRKYIPFLAVLFTYILVMNLFGLVPGFVLSTDQFPLNFGVGLVAVAMYHIWGVQAVGGLNYLKHFMGPIIWVCWLVFPVEVISHCIRPLTLGLRLYGNMLGDHILLSVFTDLTAMPIVSFVTLPFYFMGALVCFIQAFIFTLLPMVYIRMATEHTH